MLFKKTLLLMFATNASGCIHSKEQRSTISDTTKMNMSVLQVQETCDVDAFLCQNELDFTIPQDIFTSLTPKQHQEEQQQRLQRQDRQVLPTITFASSSSSAGDDKKSSEYYYHDPIGDMLNDMINFSVEMTSPVIMFSSTSPAITTSSSSLNDFDVMDKIMDDMLYSLFDTLSLSSDNSNNNNPTPTLIIERINSHGRRLLQEDVNAANNNDPARERLARRLTSVEYPNNNVRSSNSMFQHHMNTIFNKNVDKCLQKRLHDRTLMSAECGKSLNAYHTSTAAQEEEYYVLDPATLVVVLITFFIFTTTTLLLFKILLTSSTNSSASTHHETTSTMGKFCASLPLLALTIMLSYLSVTNPTFVIMVGAPVILSLGLYSCCAAEEPEEDDTAADNGLSETVDGCVPLLVRRDDLKGDEVYVAIPAVI